MIQYQAQGAEIAASLQYVGDPAVLRRKEEDVRLHPTRRRSSNRHMIPRNTRDHQQKRFEGRSGY
eukprot:10861457-Prorocentrum_lima.AAC.1